MKRFRGIDVETKIMSGKKSVEIIREVLRGQHDLVLAIAKGKHSQRNGTLGHTAFRLLRKCPGAIWLVKPGAPRKLTHILGCVDISSEQSLASLLVFANG